MGKIIENVTFNALINLISGVKVHLLVGLVPIER